MFGCKLLRIASCALTEKTHPYGASVASLKFTKLFVLVSVWVQFSCVINNNAKMS